MQVVTAMGLLRKPVRQTHPSVRGQVVECVENECRAGVLQPFSRLDSVSARHGIRFAQAAGWTGHTGRRPGKASHRVPVRTPLAVTTQEAPLAELSTATWAGAATVDLAFAELVRIGLPPENKPAVETTAGHSNRFP
jgi:hypothetical protein